MTILIPTAEEVEALKAPPPVKHPQSERDVRMLCLGVAMRMTSVNRHTLPKLAVEIGDFVLEHYDEPDYQLTVDRYTMAQGLTQRFPDLPPDAVAPYLRLVAEGVIENVEVE